MKRPCQRALLGSRHPDQCKNWLDGTEAAQQGVGNRLPLLHGDGLGQVARLVYVATPMHGDVVRQQL